MQDRSRSLSLAVTVAVGVLILSACGSDSGSTTQADDGGGSHSEFSYGEPADAADADRTIDVTATAAIRWEPATVGVKVGETVTFHITNESSVAHDFTLGDEATQDEHEAEMAEMGDDMMMADEPNAIVIEPGETRDLTWTFTQPGTVLIGCHIEGHYAAGMVAEVVVVN